MQISLLHHVYVQPIFCVEPKSDMRRTQCVSWAISMEVKAQKVEDHAQIVCLKFLSFLKLFDA